MQDLVLIPTGFKSKIPHTLSYPIGAEALSLAFADVKQFGQLTLDFWFWSRIRYTSKNTYDVLHISYSKFARSIHNRKDDATNGRLDEKWSVRVMPVPRSRRHLVKTKLESEALPVAHAWLKKNAGRDEIGTLHITFSFSEETEELIVDESSSLSPKQA